jgi:hypothetical protein
MTQQEQFITDVLETLKEHLVCEDDKLYIKTQLKYDIFNLVSNYDKEWLERLLNDLEYKEEEND